MEQQVTYAGVNQRWLIIQSAERKKSDIHKLELKIEQEKKTALKLAKKLEITGARYSHSSSKSLEIHQQKTETMECEVHRN